MRTNSNQAGFVHTSPLTEVGHNALFRGAQAGIQEYLLYLFPIAALTYHHKYHCSKQHKLIILQF